MGVSARRFDIAEAGVGVLAEAFPLEACRRFSPRPDARESGTDCCLHR
jgi:hypothetical protein